MELSHHLRRFNIYRVLIAERALLNAKNEPKSLYVLRELVRSEPDSGVIFEIVQLEGL